MLFAVIVLSQWEALVTKTNKEHILSIHDTIPLCHCINSINTTIRRNHFAVTNLCSDISTRFIQNSRHQKAQLYSTKQNSWFYIMQLQLFYYKMFISNIFESYSMMLSVA